MTFRTLVRRSLTYHWRAHLGVVLGAAIGSAALIGALVVGDSVKQSLRERALERLGKIHFALPTNDRTIGEHLAYQLHNYELEKIPGKYIRVTDDAIGVLTLRATIGKEDGSSRANQVALNGVPTGVTRIPDSHPASFWNLADSSAQNFEITSGEIWLNESLAAHLRATNGETLVVRVAKSGGPSSEAAIASRDDSSVVIRMKVGGIVPAHQLGNFDLTGSSSLPLNAFVRIEDLQRATGLTDRINLIVSPEIYDYGTATTSWLDALPVKLQSLLIDGAVKFNLMDALPSSPSLPAADATAIYSDLLRSHFRLTDAECALTVATNGGAHLTSSRVFIDPPVARAALAADPNARPILTYLANLIQAGTNYTPYSMVTAAGAPWIAEDVRDDDILLNNWMAEDLQVKAGDEVKLVYFDPESGARLVERTNTFRVRGVVPMESPWADGTLMPEFPGIEKAESTSEWDAGFPLTYKVRDKDDDYWRQYRSTPKAFITLAAGQKMWGNRFGNVTGIRFAHFIDDSGETELRRLALEQKILSNFKPEELGLRFEPVRAAALTAASGAQDFGGLFIGFSFFVIGAALLLMALLFSLGLEQRASEIGTLLALGFNAKQVRKLLLREALLLSLVGGLLGALGGLAYAKVMVLGLTTIWRDAVGAAGLSFHYTGQTLVIGIFASAIVSVLTIWLALRKFVKRPARELLVGEIHTEQSSVRTRRSNIIAVVSLCGAVALVGSAVAKGDTANAGIFFGAGALVLIAGLYFASARLGSGTTDSSTPLTEASLALRGCGRRRKRSLATIAMLASANFLIVSIGVFRLDANRDASQKTSGTGGFALIGKSTVPVVHDLNTAAGRDFFALNPRDLADVNVIPFRVREGDEASCLNLNQAQRPQLLGVRSAALTGRFTIAKGQGWNALSTGESSAGEIVVPAIGDANSIQWAMKKKIGDTIDYVDERGQPFKVRIVGAVANSILQGQLIIDEAEFIKRFPGASGYRMFLLDAPSNAVTQVSGTLSRALQDVGLELTPAPERLAQFNAVQNTYLGTFQVLGGLGLLLGSVGLGIVVLRNVLERRGELALLMAVGFRRPQLQRLLLTENGALLAAGLALGVIAAAIAVLPAVLSPGGQLPYISLGLTLSAVLLNGFIWTWAATRLAVRGDLLAALRNE